MSYMKGVAPALKIVTIFFGFITVATLAYYFQDAETFHGCLKENFFLGTAIAMFMMSTIGLLILACGTLEYSDLVKTLDIAYHIIGGLLLMSSAIVWCANLYRVLSLLSQFKTKAVDTAAPMRQLQSLFGLQGRLSTVDPLDLPLFIVIGYGVGGCGFLFGILCIIVGIVLKTSKCGSRVSPAPELLPRQDAKSQPDASVKPPEHHDLGQVESEAAPPRPPSPSNHEIDDYSYSAASTVTQDVTHQKHKHSHKPKHHHGHNKKTLEE